MDWRSTLLVLAALACCTAPAHAQWKWRDADGQIHVSDLPPPRGTPDKDILQKPDLAPRRAAAPAASAASAPAAPLLAASRPRVDSELEARRKRAEQEQADKARAEDQRIAAQRAENCQRARNHIATLDSGARLTRVKPDGEREILDDKARAEEMQRARQVVASECR